MSYVCHTGESRPKKGRTLIIAQIGLSCEQETFV